MQTNKHSLQLLLFIFFCSFLHSIFFCTLFILLCKLTLLNDEAIVLCMFLPAFHCTLLSHVNSTLKSTFKSSNHYYLGMSVFLPHNNFIILIN
jgi:hypothetical protein